MRSSNSSLGYLRQTLMWSGGAVLAICASPSVAQVSGNLALTSDYVWRGTSQTDENPALQGGLKYALDAGFYASVWGSNVSFKPDNGARSEIDLAAGWAGQFDADWALDLYVMRYQYPSADSDLNWNELNASITWRDSYWAAVGHSNNALASDTQGTYVQLGARYPLAETLRIEGSVARYVLDDRYADSYNHVSIGAVWALKAALELRATLHATDAAAKRLFPGMAGTRAEFALQTSF